MKGFITATGKATFHSAEHFQRAVAKLTEAMASPSWADSRDAAQAAWDEFKQACGNVDQDAYQGIHDELKQKLIDSYKITNEWRLSPKEVEAEAKRLFEERFPDLMSMAQNVRPYAPQVVTEARRVRATIKWARWALVFAVTAAVSAFVIHHPDPHDREAPANTYAPDAPSVATIPHIPNYLTPDLSVEEFKADLGRGTEQSQAAMSQDAAVNIPAPAIAALPPPVAAIAAQPVQVTVVDKSGNAQTIYSSLADVYYHASDSGRRDIEAKAEEAQAAAPPDKPYHAEIDHKYDLHSGEKHPAWEWQAQVESGKNWDGRKDVSGLKREQH